MPHEERASGHVLRINLDSALLHLGQDLSFSTTLSSPFGPFTETICPFTDAVTPAELELLLPIRDIATFLEYRAENFATHVLGASIRIRRRLSALIEWKFPCR
jgi:hypothetical protein